MTSLSNPTAFAREELATVPPPGTAPGRVLFVSGPSDSPATRSLQLAGHEVCECHTLAKLVFSAQIPAARPHLCRGSGDGPLDQALRIIRGRHASVPVILLTSDPATWVESHPLRLLRGDFPTPSSRNS